MSENNFEQLDFSKEDDQKKFDKFSKEKKDEIKNQAQKEVEDINQKMSKENITPIKPVPEQVDKKNVVTAEDFQNEIIATNEKHNDYVEFYKDAMRGYLDLLIEGGSVKGLYAPGYIFKEACKKGMDNSEDAEFIETFYNLSNEIKETNNKLWETDLERRMDGQVIMSAGKYSMSRYNVDEKSSIENISDKMEVSPYIADLVKTKINNRVTCYNTIKDYYTRNNHFKVNGKFKKIVKELDKFGYGKGEFVPKMKEIGNIENHINYAPTGLMNIINEHKNSVKMYIKDAILDEELPPSPGEDIEEALERIKEDFR
ncbi:MAG: hypothetical protein PF487_08855 [Bacteroidales bacterium]|jgi:uncharacterized protein YeaO (DUF488 family)|nr:hypothetical protein [Bacteroidales bacterium]